MKTSLFVCLCVCVCVCNICSKSAIVLKSFTSESQIFQSTQSKSKVFNKMTTKCYNYTSLPPSLPLPPPLSEPVYSFALEPCGSRFGVIHGEPPTRISVSFYAINDKGNKLNKISESGPIRLHFQYGQ